MPSRRAVLQARVTLLRSMTGSWAPAVESQPLAARQPSAGGALPGDTEPRDARILRLLFPSDSVSAPLLLCAAQAPVQFIAAGVACRCLTPRRLQTFAALATSIGLPV